MSPFAMDKHLTFSGVLIAALLFGSAVSFSQSEKEAAVLEIGSAASRSITDGQSAFGPTVAVEVTPMERWLELEAGVTPLFRRHSTEWSLDFLVKKPWTLSNKTEFMLGIGPEWIHTNGFGMKKNSIAAELPRTSCLSEPAVREVYQRAYRECAIIDPHVSVSAVNAGTRDGVETIKEVEAVDLDRSSVLAL
jgi:hypothetical protein